MKRKPSIAFRLRSVFLALVLVAPLLIQGLHFHDHGHCCNTDQSAGLNPLSPHHDGKNCLVCDFKYFQAISPVKNFIKVLVSGNDTPVAPFQQSEEKSEPRFASLRAPPLVPFSM